MPIPSRVLVNALNIDVGTFQDAVADATSSGIAETTDGGHLVVHPLVADYFWRSHLDSEDYKLSAARAAAVLHEHLREIPTEAPEFIRLLPTVYRLYLLSGDLNTALGIRRDLMGELAQAAITHYNRRQFALAERFIEEVLIADPQNRRILPYLARIRIRQRKWREADDLIDSLLAQRPSDIGIKHLRGWRLLREDRFPEALDVFADVLAIRPGHVASLRDIADCLYRLGRTPEALSFLSKAKQIESDNPYTLDLEARIYEESGRYEDALVAANLAVIRNPASWGMRHRRARILSALGRHPEAVVDAEEAIKLDPEQFVARSTLVSLLLDSGNTGGVSPHIAALERLAINDSQRQITVHLKARTNYLSGRLDEARALVDRQIGRQVNLAPSYGLLAQIRLAEFARLPDPSSASAQIALEQARAAVLNCEMQSDHDAGIVSELKTRIESLTALHQ